MAFKRLHKPRTRVGDQPATITIGSTHSRPGASRQVYLSISGKARQMLGDPAAIALEWDPDEWLLRIVAASPDDPDAYRLGKTPRIGITGIARELGWMWDIAATIPVKPQGRTAVLADLSQVRTRKQVAA